MADPDRHPPPVRDCSGRRRCVCWPPRSTCGRPSSAGRTSSSTPTPCAGSCAPSGVGADDVVLEVGPGLGSLTLALLGVARPGRRRRDRPGPRRGAARPPSRRTRPAQADRFDVVAGRRAAGRRRCPARRRPRWSPTCPTTSSVPVLLHLLALLPSLEHGLVMVQAEVADRLAAPPGSQGLRRPVGQGRLVRRRTPGRVGRPQRVLAGAQRRLGPGRAGPAASRRPPTATREQVFAVVDAAFAQRRKTLRSALQGAGRLGRGRRGGAGARRRRPAGARRGARRRASSPGSPRACAR